MRVRHGLWPADQSITWQYQCTCICYHMPHGTSVPPGGRPSHYTGRQYSMSKNTPAAKQTWFAADIQTHIHTYESDQSALWWSAPLLWCHRRQTNWHWATIQLNSPSRKTDFWSTMLFIACWTYCTKLYCIKYATVVCIDVASFWHDNETVTSLGGMCVDITRVASRKTLCKALILKFKTKISS